MQVPTIFGCTQTVSETITNLTCLSPVRNQSAILTFSRATDALAALVRGRAASTSSALLVIAARIFQWIASFAKRSSAESIAFLGRMKIVEVSSFAFVLEATAAMRRLIVIPPHHGRLGAGSGTRIWCLAWRIVAATGWSAYPI